MGISMKTVYRVLAYLVAAGVVVQAMAIVYGVSGLYKWISDGGVFDKATLENKDADFPETVGLAVHGLNGSLIIPLVALALFVCSFFAKVPRGVRWAGFVLLLVVIQVNLGFAAPGLPALGALHGLNALALFTAALVAGRRARVTAVSAAEAPRPGVTTAV